MMFALLPVDMLGGSDRQIKESCVLLYDHAVMSMGFKLPRVESIILGKAQTLVSISA